MVFDPAGGIPLAKASNLIRNAAGKGNLIYSAHVKLRMRERGFTTHDVLFILQHGELTGKKFKEDHGNWVYTVQGQDLDGDDGRVITAIISEQTLHIITVTG